MLVITLNQGERVFLLDQATGAEIGRVDLASVRDRRKARLSFHFPRSVRVMREELLVKEREAQVVALPTAPPPPDVPWSEYRTCPKQSRRGSGCIPLPAVPPPRNVLVSEATGRTQEVQQ